MSKPLPDDSSLAIVGPTLVVDPTKGGQIRVGPFSPLLGDREWTVGFRDKLRQFTAILNAIVKNHSLPGYSLWMNALALDVASGALCDHLLLVHAEVAASRSPGEFVSRSYAANPTVVQAFQWACGVADESTLRKTESRTDLATSSSRGDLSWIPPKSEVAAWNEILRMLESLELDQPSNPTARATTQGGASDATPVMSRNDERDQYILHRRRELVDFKAIAREIADHQDWERLEGKEGVYQALKRYCKRTGQDYPKDPRRKRARPTASECK
jgi:hypothetical protein